MKIEWQLIAEQDLLEIVQYIATDLYGTIFATPDIPYGR
jgi:hypothetical protein